jgi:hypothetical protein
VPNAGLAWGSAHDLWGATCVPDRDKVEDSEEFILAGRDFEIVEAEILPGLFVDSRPAV